MGRGERAVTERKKKKEGLMSSKRSDNGLSNILTRLNSMRHPARLVFSVPLFPRPSVYLSDRRGDDTSLLASWDLGLRTALTVTASDVKRMSAGVSHNDKAIRAVI